MMARFCELILMADAEGGSKPFAFLFLFFRHQLPFSLIMGKDFASL